MRLSNFLFFFIAGLLILASCANREMPQGGPVDKTPPNIISIEPSDGSANLPVNASFTIIFSKPMNKENTDAAIFLSPVFWGYPKFKWSGKRLTITPPETLKSNTTYILTVGAGAIDIHANKLGSSKSYAFSTGPVIDSGSISGAIFSLEGQRVTYDIWAYALGDTNVTNFWNRIPDYATQVDSAGGFKIEHLSDNRYFIIAINDKNDDLFWDPSSEEIGLPPGIVKLSGEKRTGGILFQPARRDTSLAYITKATPLSRQRLSVEFSSQPKMDLELSRFSYQIKYGDSILSFGSPYIGADGKLILETDHQVLGRSYQLLPINLVNIWNVPFDTTGVWFTGVNAPDTTGPTLLSSFPPNGSTGVYEDSIVEITFSKRIQILTFPSAVSAVADSVDTLKFLPTWLTPNQVRMRFPGHIPREIKVTITLFPKKITDIFQNPMPDSALAFTFRLPPVDTVGSVAASLESGQPGTIIGILSQYSRGGESFKGHFDGSGELSLNSVMPGTYRFEFFADSDSDGEWSPGMISPYKPAERFAFLPDTVKVRSRWTTDIGSVSLPNLDH